MRPLKLRMKAFGPYADEVLVDFTKVSNGLFLITGDTGAGKTTIYDGISMALFGEASGGSNKKGEKKPGRSFDMLHSDYVPYTVPSEVELEFLHNKTVYRVIRTQSYSKRRKSENEYDAKAPTACLYVDGVLDESSKTPTEVNARIKSVLGFNADQFKKIIMLAQGEFKKFLESDSDAKNEIIGELFDNSACRYFQNLLKEARDTLSKEREEKGTKVIKNTIMNIRLSENTPEELKAIIFPEQTNYKELTEALTDIVSEDEKEEKNLKKEKEEFDKQKAALNKQLGEAKGNNRLLKEMEEKKAHNEELNSKKDIYLSREAVLKQVEKASNQVLNQYNLHKAAKNNVLSTENEIEKLTNSVILKQEEKKKEEEALSKLKEKEEQIIEKRNDIARIKSSLPAYELIEEKIRNHDNLKNKLEEIRQKKDGLITKKQKTADEKKEKERKLEELKNSASMLLEAKQRVENAEQKYNAFTKEQGISDKFNNILKDIQKYRAGLDDYNKTVIKAKEAFDNYSRIYKLFLDGQAGLMAKKLKEELEIKESCACPVCNTVFTKYNKPEFADYSNEIPKESDVNFAKKESDEYENTRISLKNANEILFARIKEQKNNVTLLFNNVVKEEKTWEEISADNYMAKVIALCKNEVEEERKSYNYAKEKNSEYESLCKEIKELEEALIELDKEYNDAVESFNSSNADIEALKAVISEKKKSVPYESIDIANQELSKATRIVTEYENMLMLQDEKVKSITSLYEKDYGLLDGRKKDLPGLRDKEKEEEELLNKVLKECGFNSIEEARNLLIDVVGSESTVKQIGEWVENERAQISTFKNDCINTEHRLNELKAVTENMIFTDTETLEKLISEVSEKLDIVNDKLTQNYNYKMNHIEALESIKQAADSLTETSQAWNRIDALANLAVGENSEGGKLSFERYVSGYIFREILEYANQRLDDLSGGRYSLLHKLSVNHKAGAAGLEISVLDRFTGKARDTATISGGESFIVSLALALGLSDVVIAHAGGVQLDTLFIDEGFGTLDEQRLSDAVNMLNRLTQGNRLVGIISHVENLETAITEQFIVKSTQKGSKVYYKQI